MRWLLVRCGTRTLFRFDRGDLIHEPLIAVERAIEILLLTCDHIADLGHRRFQVRELDFNRFESVCHGDSLGSDPIC